MQTAKLRGFMIAVGAGAAAMVLGAFGPWVKVLTLSVSGVDNSNDGWLVIVAAIFGLLVFRTESWKRAGMFAFFAPVHVPVELWRHALLDEFHEPRLLH